MPIVSHLLQLNRGAPLPFGASVVRDGINFAIFSRHATTVTLLLFHPGELEPFQEFTLDPRLNRTGDVWHGFIDNLAPGIHYAYRMDKVPNVNPLIYRYDSANILMDPCGRVVVGRPNWGERVGGRETVALRLWKANSIGGTISL
jgi:isoamylase